MSKVKRKVTVENSKDSQQEQPRRPSVFERLGPGAANIASQPHDRHSRVDANDKCRNWLRSGICPYGNTCKFQHETYSSSKRSSKSEKESVNKDLRHKVRTKRDDTSHEAKHDASTSPKAKESKRSGSRSRKGEHESKIKSTVVVTRPRSPPLPGASSGEGAEKEKKKVEGSWEEDSDDWPLDAAQLDFKEELTLERKRQQLQRELEELQKEKRIKEDNVTIMKTVSYSESSSSSSSSGSGSITSSSGSSSSSSEDDSDDSSSTSSTSSSSTSKTPIKKKYKKQSGKKQSATSSKATTGASTARKKPLDDYDKIKSSRVPKPSITRARSPSPSEPSGKKSKGRRGTPPPETSKRKSGREVDKKPTVVRKGPRTPSRSPVKKKHRGQSSSADSWSADTRKNHGKRHKKKKDPARNDRFKGDYAPTPPPLSSPNRTALLPHIPISKKPWRDDSASSSHHKVREHSPLLLSRVSKTPGSPLPKSFGGGSAQYSEDKYGGQSKSRKSSKSERNAKSTKETFHDSTSPYREGNKFESETALRKNYPPLSEKEAKGRRRSTSVGRQVRDSTKSVKKQSAELEKYRGAVGDYSDISPRMVDNNSRREAQYRGGEHHQMYSKKEDSRMVQKRPLSPEMKKDREEKFKERGGKDRMSEPMEASWDHKKSSSKMLESRGRLEPPPSSQSSSRSDRTKDRDRDRKKGKDREPTREELDRERQRISPASRGPFDIHPHHSVRDELAVPRGHMYQADLPPPEEREFVYRDYDPLREPPPYLDECLRHPDYEADLIRGVPPMYPPLESEDYPPPGYPPDPHYRRDIPMKEPPPLMDRMGGYRGHDMSPIDLREPIPMAREEDYLSDLPLDERRAYNERWGRNRPIRDEWDAYPPMAAAPLPPHITPNLDEDRYGMPRRRRTSPEWRGRRDERELPPIHEPRIRSPQHRRNEEPLRLNKPNWSEPVSDRRASGRSDSRAPDNQQKGTDDRKGRNNRRDRTRDRASKDDPPPEAKSHSSKDGKSNGKRPRSPSPVKRETKRKRENEPETVSASDKNEKQKQASGKKSKEESKREEAKPSSSSSSSTSSSRKVKTEPTSPKPEPSSKVSEKAEIVALEKTESKTPVTVKQEVIEKKADVKMELDDDFSDWSEFDENEVLSRDFNDSESNSNDKVRIKSEDVKKEKSTGDTSSIGSGSKEGHESSKRDRSRSRVSELKSESRGHRPSSKERNGDGLSHSSKHEDLAPRQQGSKESAASGANTGAQVFAVESDDGFVTYESVDYDPISDDELEAMIEEPDETVTKTSDGNEEPKVVDALDVNWSVLMSESKPECSLANARERFKAAHVLSRIGFSQRYAGQELTAKIQTVCQKQLDEEFERAKADGGSSEKQVFRMQHKIASFHVALAQRDRQRAELFSQSGSSGRAMCARQDLTIRKLLSRRLGRVSTTCV